MTSNAMVGGWHAGVPCDVTVFADATGCVRGGVRRVSEAAYTAWTTAANETTPIGEFVSDASAKSAVEMAVQSQKTEPRFSAVLTIGSLAVVLVAGLRLACADPLLPMRIFGGLLAGYGVLAGLLLVIFVWGQRGIEMRAAKRQQRGEG